MLQRGGGSVMFTSTFVGFLASDASSLMTGTAMLVDGGVSISRT